MTSFVREILSASGKLGDKEDLATKANRLQKKVDEIKAQMRKDVEDRYANYLHNFGEAESAASKLRSAAEEVESLRNTVNLHLRPEVAGATRDMQAVLKQLQELSATVQISNVIRSADAAMTEANQCLDAGDYLGATVKLKEVMDLVGSDPPPDLQGCDSDKRRAFEAIKLELAEGLEKVAHELNREWEERFSIAETKNKDGVKTVTMRLSVCQPKGRLSNEDLVRAMGLADLLDFRAGRFAARMLDLVLRPLVATSVAAGEVAEESPAGGGTVVSMVLKWQGNWRKRPVATDVFMPLAEAFGAVFRAFNILVPKGDESEEESLMLHLGDRIFTSFAESLIKDCLTPAVPSAKSDLESYNEVAENARTLSNYLSQINFVRGDDECPIAAFVANIDDVFADNRVASLLDQARTIIKNGDLHEAQRLEETSILSDEQFKEALSVSRLKVDDLDDTFLGGEGLERMTLPELEEMGSTYGFAPQDSVFKFPACKISNHVTEFMDLVNSTLEEACESDSSLSYRLVDASRLMFQLYIDCVPVFHSEELKQFPQHCALALTNYFYLSHQCIMLGFEFRSRLSKEVEARATFADLVLPLRLAGIEIFQEQMRKQRDGLKEILKESGFSKLHGEAQIAPKTEKGLKQVLHQLSHLRKVWQHVLPAHIYSRAMGVLLDWVTEQMVLTVVGLEDIAADVAVQIVTLFNQFENKAPEIFVIEGDESGRSSKHDVVRFVRTWQRFKELIFVLNANLKEIEDRWAAGKGPLATEFQVEEMKRLIRALFQNTDRRATVLSRIKYES